MSKDWKQQSVFIAGLGSIGLRHLRALQALDVKNISAFDPIPASVTKALDIYPQLQIRSSYEEGLAAGPDGVFILTPPKMHIPMILQALDSGCNVFCEKPLSDTLDGTVELSHKLSCISNKLCIGLCFRYHRGIQRAKALLESGAVGRIVSIRSLMGEHFPSVRPDYKTLFSARYSGAFDLMHDLDLAIWFADQPISQIYSVYGSYSDIGIKAPDVAEILIGFADRCTATVHLDFFQRPRRRQIELICTEGCILVDFSTWDQCTLSTYRTNNEAWETETFATDRDDMFREEDQAFLESIAGNSHTQVYGMEDAMLSLNALHQIQNR